MSALTVNQSYLKETLLLKKRLESSFLSLGERLMRIRDERLWEGSYENFVEFLHEARLSEGTASRLISVHQRFILDFKMKHERIASIGWSTLYEIGKEVSTKKEAEEFIEKALVLRRGDVQDDLREKKTGCRNHSWGEKIILRRCETCGKTVKDYE